jgi:2,4-dienoyl-CoA reductase-like NADH-dependent reductase (Old Yellow Enzyme family)
MPDALFSPLKLRNLSLPNRIVVSPMCQHTAVGGCANDWHMLHLGTLSVSNAGLVMIEATAVERDGRISRGCLGL